MSGWMSVYLGYLDEFEELVEVVDRGPEDGWLVTSAPWSLICYRQFINLFHVFVAIIRLFISLFVGLFGFEDFIDIGENFELGWASALYESRDHGRSLGVMAWKREKVCKERIKVGGGYVQVTAEKHESVHLNFVHFPHFLEGGHLCPDFIVKEAIVLVLTAENGDSNQQSIDVDRSHAKRHTGLLQLPRRTGIPTPGTFAHFLVLLRITKKHPQWMQPIEMVENHQKCTNGTATKEQTIHIFPCRAIPRI